MNRFIAGLAVLVLVAFLNVPTAYAGGRGRGPQVVPAVQVNHGDQLAVVNARGANFRNGLLGNSAIGNEMFVNCGCFFPGGQLNTGNQTAILDLTHAHFGGGAASNAAIGNSATFGN